MKKSLFTLLLTSVFASAAFADQCVVVDEAQAKAITNIVKVGDMIGTLCEPCGEEPTELGGPSFEEVVSIGIEPFEMTGIVQSDDDSEENFYQVVINGKPVDLAYTYITTTRSNYYTVTLNAAFYVGCYATDVTPQFVIGD